MKYLRSFWNWLDGRKRTIALIYWSIVVPCMGVIWPVNAPGAVSKTVTIVGLILSAVGLGHAAIKSRAASNEEAKEEVIENVVEKEVVVDNSAQTKEIETQGTIDAADKKDS